jgi:hypothetical protein
MFSLRKSTHGNLFFILSLCICFFSGPLNAQQTVRLGLFNLNIQNSGDGVKPLQERIQGLIDIFNQSVSQNNLTWDIVAVIEGQEKLKCSDGQERWAIECLEQGIRGNHQTQSYHFGGIGFIICTETIEMKNIKEVPIGRDFSNEGLLISLVTAVDPTLAGAAATATLKDKLNGKTRSTVIMDFNWKTVNKNYRIAAAHIYSAPKNICYRQWQVQDLYNAANGPNTIFIGDFNCSGGTNSDCDCGVANIGMIAKHIADNWRISNDENNNYLVRFMKRLNIREIADYQHIEHISTLANTNVNLQNYHYITAFADNGYTDHPGAYAEMIEYPCFPITIPTPASNNFKLGRLIHFTGSDANSAWTRLSEAHTCFSLSVNSRIRVQLPYWFAESPTPSSMGIDWQILVDNGAIKKTITSAGGIRRPNVDIELPALAPGQHALDIEVRTRLLSGPPTIDMALAGSASNDAQPKQTTLSISQLPCIPNCIGRRCGDNGCGGSCGDCPEGFYCSNHRCIQSNDNGDHVHPHR